MRLSNGTRYEVDPKRSLLKVGSRGSYQGKVYPRISICQKYPWFDVDVGNQNRIAANQTQKETVVTYDGSTSIQLVASQAQLQQRLREASELKEQMPAGVLVSVGLRPTGVSSAREKWQILKNAANEIRKGDWRLLEKIQLHVISPNTPDGVIQRSPKGERNFPDVATFLIEWNRDNHPSS